MRQERKRDMRREMKVILANLDKRWEAAAHVEVCQHLCTLIRSLPRPVEHVLAWIPCFPGEVDLTGFIAEMLRSRHVYLPRVEEAGAMTFVRITQEWSSRLERSVRGVFQPEPGYGEMFDPSGAEGIAVIAPGLAFDRHGRRLGRGGGYYDRFLAGPLTYDAVRVGVCWSMQLVPEIPTDPHDVAMDFVCHERGVVRVEGERL